jgi:hypothetical protein
MSTWGRISGYKRAKKQGIMVAWIVLYIILRASLTQTLESDQ